MQKKNEKNIKSGFPINKKNYFTVVTVNLIIEGISPIPILHNVTMR